MNSSTNIPISSAYSSGWFTPMIYNIFVTLTSGHNNPLPVMETSQHQEDDNIIQNTSNDVMSDLNVVKTTVMNSGYALMGDLSNSWSVLGEGMKVVSTDIQKEATNAFQNIQTTSAEVPNDLNVAKTAVMNSGHALIGELSNSLPILSEGIKVVGAEAQKGATNIFQNLATGVKNKIYSPWMDEGINRVNNILDKLKNKAAHKTYNFPMLLTILQRLQQISREQQSIKQNSSERRTSNQYATDVNIDRVKRYGEIALQIGPTIVWRQNQDVATILNIEETDILQTWFYDDDSGVHCPKFIVFVDHATKAIVLAIRGSYSIRDALMDVVSDSVPYLHGWAHRGIQDGAKKILQESGNVLQEALINYPNYSLVICGHSLGGGAAELITLDIMYGDGGHKIGFSCQDRNIACYAFGAPPVFVSNGETVPIEVPQINIFVNRADVVPTLSLATVGKTLDQISALDSLELTFLEKSELMFENTFRDLDIRWSVIKDGIFQNVDEVVFHTGEMKTNFESIAQIFLEQFLAASEKEVKNIQMEDDPSFKLRTIVNETMMDDDTSDEIYKDCLEWILQDDGSWNANFLNRERININNVTENISLLHNSEDDARTEETNSSVDVEENKTDFRNMKDKLSKALETMKQVKDDETYVYLRHPGVLYHMEKSKADHTTNASSKNGFVLRRYSTPESVSYIRNIRLDIVNMVIDHLPAAYSEAFSNLS